MATPVAATDARAVGLVQVAGLDHLHGVPLVHLANQVGQHTRRAFILSPPGPTNAEYARVRQLHLLGSIITMRTCSGVDRSSTEEMMQLMQPLLPEPVVPR